MSATIPSNYTVFTRAVSNKDPNLSKYGLTCNDVISYMANNHVFLLALDETGECEVKISTGDLAVELAVNDLSVLSDKDMKELMAGLEMQYKAAGISIVEQDVVRHGKARYIRIIIDLGGGTTNGLQYITIYNDRAYYITMEVVEGKINSDRKKEMKSIVESIRFDKEASVAIAVAAFLQEHPILNILLRLFLNFLLCVVPVIIYRFCIIKESADDTKRKKAVILFSIPSFFALLAVLLWVNTGVNSGDGTKLATLVGYAFGGCFVCGWINRGILACGTKKAKSSMQSTETLPMNQFVTGDEVVGITPSLNNQMPTGVANGSFQADPGIIFCSQCGERVSKSHRFCPKCGGPAGAYYNELNR